MANQYRSVLAGAGGTGGDAVAANVLSGKTFTNDNGFDTGTMTNNGAVTQTLSAGQSYTIPEGYHDGTGTVTADEYDTLTLEGDISGYSTVSINDAVVGALYLVVATNMTATTISSITGATQLSNATQAGTSGNGIANVYLVKATASTISVTFSTSASGSIMAMS